MNSGLVFMKLVEGKMSFNLQLENLVVGPTTICTWKCKSAFLWLPLGFYSDSLVTIIQCAYQLSMVRQECTRLHKTAPIWYMLYVVRTRNLHVCISFSCLVSIWAGWLVPIIQREINLYDPTRLYRTHPIRTWICTLHYPDWQLYKAKGFISVGYD